MNRCPIIRDESGAVLVETTVMLTLFFVFVLGSIDFMMMFYQWNAATKALQVGARIAQMLAGGMMSGLPAVSGAVARMKLPTGMMRRRK